MKRLQRQVFKAASLLVLAASACSAPPGDDNSDLPGDGDGDLPGDGDGDLPGDGDGDLPGDGDGDGDLPGDGDGDLPGDGDGDLPGDGDGDLPGDGDGDGDSTAECPASVPGSPQLRRLTGKEFNTALDAVFPDVAGQWVSSFSSDLVSDLGYTNESGSLTVSDQFAREVDATGAELASAVVSNLAAVLPCSSAAADRACAADFITTYGKRLYRRPVSQSESEAMLNFFDEASSKTDFSTAIGWLTRSLIHSPSAVYRSEIGAVNGEQRLLSQYEIATAIAFAFTGTTPSDSLLTLADGGGLSSIDALRRIAQELISSPAGQEHFQSFFSSWLEYGKVTSATKSEVLEFPALRGQMLEETRRFIQAVVFDAKGSLADLLTSPLTYPSAELASFYGFPAPSTDYGVITRPETGGIGVLAQGSLLSTEAKPNSSSPTQRGLLVMEKLLCEEPPAPPPSVPPIQDPIVGEITTRERYENVHAVGACGACHAAFDPIGFGFEHFDEVGRYRSDEGGLTIDSTGHVPAESGTLFEFDGQIQLAQGLATQAQVASCASGHMKAYAFGSQASCLGESERALFIQGAIGFVDYLASLATEPQFTQRSLQ